MRPSQTAAMLTISVVICAFTMDRWDALAAALKSVDEQRHPADEVILVIDHNPSLRRASAERWGDVRVIENDGVRGLSDARNTGVRAAHGDIVAFLDDDAVASPQWLERLAAAYADPGVVAAGGAVVPRWETGRPRWFPAEFDWVVGCSHSGMPATRSRVRNLVGAGMSFRREVLEAAGGFSTALGRIGTKPVGCEETDMCIRATAADAGATIVYDPAAVVDHAVPPARATLRYFVARCLAEGRSKAVLAGRVGNDDALASERTYVRSTLGPAVIAHLRTAPTAGGPARVGAMMLGLAATTAGYAIGRSRPSVRRLARRTAQATPGRLPRIVMVTPRFPPDVGGGARHVREVARRLVADGCEVTVVCTDRTGTLPRREQVDGIDVRRVRAWPRDRDYYVAPGLWRAMGRATPCDVVHVQSWHTFVAPLAMLRARQLGIPFVLTFHGGGHSSRTRRSLRGVQRAALAPLVRRAARLVAVARFEIPLYARAFGVPPERFALIPNGIDTAAAPADAATSPGPLVISSIGRLERYKGHHRVLAALPHVLATHPDARVRVVGTGPEEPALRRQAIDLGVAERVEFVAVPADAPERMQELLRTSTVVVCLSEFETHPLVALEAVAAGRPVLVAATSGLQELADDGLATAIPIDSHATDVAAAIASLLTQPPATTAPRLASWDDCADQLLSLYRDVASCAS
jgi:glycosyltransferase involved in cell wall biosynthesis/GT2 family glycosyltransferase